MVYMQRHLQQVWRREIYKYIMQRFTFVIYVKSQV